MWAHPLLMIGGTEPMLKRVKPSEPTGSLTRELLGYWILHPKALGTLEAIVEWWLLEYRIQRAAGEIRSVLAELIAKQFVVERRQADGRSRYELNQGKADEIRHWLAGPGRA